MECKKLVAGRIYPVLLSIINSNKAVLVCLMYQELNEKRSYSETVIEFFNPTQLKLGSKINLIGDGINKVMEEKNKENTIITAFDAWPELNSGYYYKCDGTDTKNKYHILVPRQEFVRIRYTINSIMLNGGYTKSAARIYQYSNMNFVKIEDLKLEGSKITGHRDLGSQKISIIKNIWNGYCGPKEYKLVETVGAIRVLEDNDLKTPVPDYVFDKVYKEIDEVERLKMVDGEILLIQFCEHSYYHDLTTVYCIRDKHLTDRLSSKYFIKEI